MVMTVIILSTLFGLIQPGASLDLRDDPESIKLASTDYGNIVEVIPALVLYPTSVEDIADVVGDMFERKYLNFGIAARGRGHSIRGQAGADNGIVINMTNLSGFRNGTGFSGIVISSNGSYVDVGGEQLWVDVLETTLTFGRSPVSWTDYLYLSVGGTLSNAGISGQTFRFGPQISNVMELDVVTGKGELMTCSPTTNSDLFFGALGGLGQFGIITRARIVLDQAPTRVKWGRILYTNFSEFAADQENLILNNGKERKDAVDYVEGLLLLSTTTQDNTSFFAVADQPRILSLVNQHGIVYCLEVARYYYDKSAQFLEKELENDLSGSMKYELGFMFEKDVTYSEFLNRVHYDELNLRKLGLWEVPHPWLNLFVPKSRIIDFDSIVFRDIVLKRNLTNGVILSYPTLRNKWDDRMSAITPNGDIFYVVSFLFSSGFDGWQAFDGHNKDILDFCATAGIQLKEYLPQYASQEDWAKHFGPKWETFQQRKDQFDPKKILSPGQKIFN